jgi:hypothetical protein
MRDAQRAAEYFVTMLDPVRAGAGVDRGSSLLSGARIIGRVLFGFGCCL